MDHAPPVPPPFIDAHHHFWDLDHNPHPWLQDEPVAHFRYGSYAALKRNYLPEDFARDTGACAPAASVHIEAEWSRAAPVDETRWLTTLAQRYQRPSVVVAHADLADAEVSHVLAAQAAFAMVRGIRHKPVVSLTAQDARRGEAGSMDDGRWRDGYAWLEKFGLSFDLQAPWWHLEQALDLARDFPATPLVLNHTGLPSDRSAQGLARWRQALARLADAPNTALKISGLGQRDVPWTASDNVPVIQDAIAIFGADRCMFASNFPVDSLVTSYGAIVSAFAQAIAPLAPAQQRALWGGNAARIYRIANWA
ncbi:amidohydrolase family protein [Acidovorax sp. Be4]|uniref:Amidohydrolase family protein n=1 Tax=Acidovorax bellezanensis TaxID=2976702 RepID=A0ABT2PSH8_9BURK|nr:amidohydrolase family protein [Acidovorax sp. Be4]MCT9813432.1 amidohydrolase family protein [Acidovorax sp. Be4]